MKYKVYHTRNWELNSKLRYIDSPDLCPEYKDGYKPFAANYKHVATVECDNIRDTFYYTNHINRSWWEHQNIELIEESRSTSVGDLVEDENGKLYMVASVGFTEVVWSDPSNDLFEVISDEYGDYIIPKKDA